MSVAKRGDTLIEVVLSFVMFSLVAAISISVMHAGISGAEASIELTLARIEIDSQSETARFVQESFANDHSYKNLWGKITERAIPEFDAGGAKNEDIPKLDVMACEKLYKSSPGDIDSPMTVYEAKAFVLNPRRIEDELDKIKYTLVTADDETDSKFAVSSLNPRVIYTTEDEEDSSDAKTTDDSLSDTDDEEKLFNTVYRAEGIYDFIVKDVEKNSTNKPSHYDLHIYTCWFTPGAEHPTTIGTVTRLFNPEFLNE